MKMQDEAERRGLPDGCICYGTGGLADRKAKRQRGSVLTSCSAIDVPPRGNSSGSSSRYIDSAPHQLVHPG